ELSDSLSLSFLVLLETLSPVERAVFLLRQVFGYGYDEIADVIGKSEANCRQILARAQKRIDEGKTRFDVDRDRQRELVDRFAAAAQQGEMEGLLEALAADVVFYGDGGGKGRGLPKPVYTATGVERLLQSFLARYQRGGARLVSSEVNGDPAVLAFD